MFSTFNGDKQSTDSWKTVSDPKKTKKKNAN